MNMNKIILGSLASLGLALAGQLAFADTKCSPDFKVTYEGTAQGSSVKVVAIEYRLDGTSEWHREDVTNSVINDKGGNKTFKSQTLGSAAKGQKIDARAVFLPDTGKGFGSEKKGELRESGKACENNVTYSLIVK
jgi:hypothetical protein